MIFKNKPFNFTFKIKLKDHWPHHILLLELKDGQVLFLDTTNENKRIFESMQKYIDACYMDKATTYPHLLHFTNITHTKSIKQMLEKYTTIQKVQIVDMSDYL